VLTEPFIKSIVVDNYGPMCELVQDLADRGYRKYAFVAGIDTEDTRERFFAFKTVLEKNRIPFRPESYFTGDFTRQSGYRAAKLILISGQLPQVLVCANDGMALGAIEAFREEGLRVPQDMAVTGFDDGEISEIMGLSTVTIPNYERGYLAAQHLLFLMEGTAGGEPFKIPARVCFRSTVLPQCPAR
jgi:LacI family transcriptional regulator